MADAWIILPITGFWASAIAPCPNTKNMGSVKSFMKILVFIQRSKKRGILSWLELELCKGSAQAS